MTFILLQISSKDALPLAILVCYLFSTDLYYQGWKFIASLWTYETFNDVEATASYDREIVWWTVCSHIEYNQLIFGLPQEY